MKTKVIIENGETLIELCPENDFERDIIEKVKDKGSKFNIHTIFDADYSFGGHQKHKIAISIKEIR